MQIPIGERREILLYGGENLKVTSSNIAAVPNDGFSENMSRSDGLRSLWPYGGAPGISLLQAGTGASNWCTIELQIGPITGFKDEPDSDLTIIMTPVQLAATLEQANLTETETTSNRLWGGLNVLIGALELVGSSALIVTPEPTMVTKAAGVVLAAHGSDTISAGIQQLIDGNPHTTLTAQAAQAAALKIGMDPDEAIEVGMVVDVAVPTIAGGAGYLKVGAVRAGQMRLLGYAYEEGKFGGHVYSRHVNISEAWLRRRLARQLGIDVASSFRTIDEAQRFISETLRLNAPVINSWAATAQVGSKSRPFVMFFNETTGYGVFRATGLREDVTGVRVILKKIANTGKIYIELTAFPIMKPN
jgi:hypothetical protein